MIYNEDLEAFKKSIDIVDCCICGVDYGLKKVGIAISDRDGKIAFPYTTLLNSNQLLAEVLHIFQEHQVKAMVVGLPRDLNAGLHLLYRDIVIFLKELESKIDIHILLWDERMSTRGAVRNILALPKQHYKTGKRTRNSATAEKKMIRDDDRYAAAYILQEVLDCLSITI